RRRASPLPRRRRRSRRRELVATGAARVCRCQQQPTAHHRGHRSGESIRVVVSRDRRARRREDVVVVSKPRRAAAPSQHRYPRTARLNESLREVIAEALTRIDDERLDMVTVTSIDVDSEMNRAIVYFDSLLGEDGDADILTALASHR